MIRTGRLLNPTYPTRRVAPPDPWDAFRPLTLQEPEPARVVVDPELTGLWRRFEASYTDTWERRRTPLDLTPEERSAWFTA